MGGFEPIHHLIQDFSKDHALGQKLLEVRLQEEWPSIVGQTLAKHSSPDSIRFHKLYLVAENSVWLQQLVFLKSSILEALQSRIPELSLVDIILRLGPLPAPMVTPKTWFLMSQALLLNMWLWAFSWPNGFPILNYAKPLVKRLLKDYPTRKINSEEKWHEEGLRTLTRLKFSSWLFLTAPERPTVRYTKLPLPRDR